MRIGKKILAATAVFFVAAFAIPGNATINADTGNLAKGKPVKASGDADNCPPANAVDGVSTSRWSSPYSDGQWIYVDLGQTAEITQIVIYWETAYGSEYLIQVSDDAEDWTDVAHITDGDGIKDEINLYGVGRYVRMLGLKRGTQYGFSIYEFEVYGELVVPVNIALDKPIDTDGKNCYTIDLYTRHDISYIAMHWGAEFLDKYIIKTSDDGEKWLDIVTNTNGKGGSDVLGTTARGRYVKIEAAAEKAFEIESVEIFGKPTPDNAPPVWGKKANSEYELTGRYSAIISWATAIGGSGLNGYRIYQGKNLLETVTDGTLEYEVNGLTGGKTYSFKIEAGDEYGNWSEDGPVITFTMPGEDKERRGFSYTYPEYYGDWANGFMAGNGKQGVIVFGNPIKETVIFNDRGFNIAASKPRYFNEVSAEDLQQIKDYLVNEQWKEANDLANAVHGWQDGGEGNRHPGYKMMIAMPENGSIVNYVRETNYSTGEISVNYTDDTGDWTRKTFVSRADGVTVQYIPAPEGGKVTCSIELGVDTGMNFPNGMTFTNVSDEDFLKLRVKYPSATNNAGYEGVTRVITEGGTKTINGNSLTVTDAEWVLLLTKTQKYYADAEAEWAKEELAKELESINYSYDELLQRNIEVHGEIYDRVELNLNASPEERALPNEELLSLQKTSKTPVAALYERMFDSGRFHFLCSSGEYETPDLLGNWTGDCNVGWNGYYHLDANLNLQVAGGNIGNMAEAMEGYFWLNEQWQEDFRTNAQKLLGTRGMLAGGNTPGATSGYISALSYYYPYQYVTGEEAWLLYPFWEHYLITGDIDFLRDDLYPLLRDMGDFYEDFLTETDENGNYIFAGSISPENQPGGLGFSLVNNSTFDISSAKFALETLIKVCGILGVEQGEGVLKWQAILDKLPPYLINGDGALAEWSWEGLRESYGHRHSSGLVPVWPYREITPEDTPEFYDAAQETLRRKDMSNYENAGHGLLHSALNAANLNNAESVNQKLLRFASEDFYFDSLTTAHYINRGVFCTDVLHTVPAIMMEMLALSDEGVLELLPALINSAEKGSITGMKGRSRITIDNLAWDMANNYVECTITSDIDQVLTVIQRRGIEAARGDKDVYASELGDIARDVNLKAGEAQTVYLYLKNENGENTGNAGSDETKQEILEKTSIFPVNVGFAGEETGVSEESKGETPQENQEVSQEMTQEPTKQPTAQSQTPAQVTETVVAEGKGGGLSGLAIMLITGGVVLFGGVAAAVVLLSKDKRNKRNK